MDKLASEVGVEGNKNKASIEFDTSAVKQAMANIQSEKQGS